MPIKLNTASGGGVILQGANTASDKTITIPADDGTMVYANSSGNVGIGTSSPTFSSGSGVHINSAAAGPAVLHMTTGNQGTAANNGLDIRFGAGDVNLWNYGNGFMAFATNNAERARIDSSGNFYVGTTTSRSSYITTVCDATYNGVTVTADITGARTACSFRNPNGAVGSITTSGTATAYNTSSDYRLKENVQPMTGALAKISALKPCTYTWKTDGSAGEGFIAHELAEVVPGCVTGEKDAVDADGNPVYQGIDTSFLAATLTAAIQEQQAMIEELKAKVVALEAK